MYLSFIYTYKKKGITGFFLPLLQIDPLRWQTSLHHQSINFFNPVCLYVLWPCSSLQLFPFFSLSFGIPHGGKRSFLTLTSLFVVFFVFLFCFTTTATATTRKEEKLFSFFLSPPHPALPCLALPFIRSRETLFLRSSDLNLFSSCATVKLLGLVRVWSGARGREICG